MARIARRQFDQLRNTLLEGVGYSHQVLTDPTNVNFRADLPIRGICGYNSVRLPSVCLHLEVLSRVNRARNAICYDFLNVRYATALSRIRTEPEKSGNALCQETCNAMFGPTMT